MTTYLDPNPGYRLEIMSQPEVRPANLIPALEAARHFVREYEPGTIAHALQQMFAEADQRIAAGYGDIPVEQFAAQAYPRRPEAFRDFLKFIEHRQKTSDAVRYVRGQLRSGQPAITEFHMADVGRAWNRGFNEAVRKFRKELPPEYINKLVFAGRAELSFSIPDLVAERMILISQHPELVEKLGGDALLETEEKRLGCLLGDLQFLDTKGTKQVLAYLRRSGTDRTEDQWKNSVKLLRQAQYRSDYQAIIDSQEYQQAQHSISS